MQTHRRPPITHQAENASVLHTHKTHTPTHTLHISKSNMLCCTDILTDRIGKETGAPSQKGSVCDSRHRKVRGKPYGKGAHRLHAHRTSVHVALKRHQRRRSDFKKAADCRDKPPSDLRTQKCPARAYSPRCL